MSRIAKDVINNVCEVNLNLAYVSQESLMIDCFAFLEMGGGGVGGEYPCKLILLSKQQKKSLEAI